nr:hypothetical protein [Tanacetum cinerariifolium]
PTEMELELEQSQQGSSHEVSVSTEGVEELKRITKRQLLSVKVVEGGGAVKEDGGGGGWWWRRRCDGGGGVVEVDNSNVELALVVFNAHGSSWLLHQTDWTNDVKCFLNWLPCIEFIGSKFCDAAIAEGLAQALTMFPIGLW